MRARAVHNNLCADNLRSYRVRYSHLAVMLTRRRPTPPSVLPILQPGEAIKNKRYHYTPMKFGRARHVPYSFSFFYCSGVSVYMYNVLCFVSGRDVIRGGGCATTAESSKASQRSGHREGQSPRPRRRAGLGGSNTNERRRPRATVRAVQPPRYCYISPIRSAPACLENTA